MMLLLQCLLNSMASEKLCKTIIKYLNNNDGTHHVFHSRNDLSKDHLGFQVGQLPPRGDSGEKVPTATILHHQVDLPAGLKHLVQPHNVGVAQLLHAADLRGGQQLTLLVQTLLVHHFDRNSL